MTQIWKNLITSGKNQKSYNRFHKFRLYIVIGSIVLLLAFGAYTQILIREAKEDAQFVPRLFAQYIAYTDSYLKEAQKNTELITEVLVKYLQVAGEYDFQEKMWTYLNTQFINKMKIPIIITDENDTPTTWYHVDVPEDKAYSSLSEEEQNNLAERLEQMLSIPIISNGVILGYACFRRPISFEQFIKKIDYSIVVTDRRRIPLYWRNIEVAENKEYDELLPQEKQILKEHTTEMYEIPISNEADSLGFAYFSSSNSLSQIRDLSYLQLLLMVVIIVLGVYGLLIIRRTEKDVLWISLAKETAHQFGTPVTSLMGWIDYLRSHPKGFTNLKEYTQFVEWITADLEKLRTIASRFGKIGSAIKLIPEDLQQILQEMTDYFAERLPHQGSKIEIHLISNIEGIKVLLDVDLFKWTMENMIKNSIDSIGKKGGNIIITAIAKPPNVYVLVKDDGKGIPRRMWKKVFDPGTTTKVRGWGLGLSLAKRIVEEYHLGKIRILESTVNEGSTFEIMLHMHDKE